MRRALNRTSAAQILRFFDICFKQGVIDACAFNDDHEARLFLDRHKAAWDFGVLGESEEGFDWEIWRVKLYQWGRAKGMKSFLTDYVYQITRKNHLWYFFIFAMRFYLMGIEEWLEYPAPAGIERFKTQVNIHWKKVEASCKNITKTDKIVYMQEIAHEYLSVPLDERTLKPVTMDGFCRAMHDLTRPYAYKSRGTIEWYEEPDHI